MKRLTMTTVRALTLTLAFTVSPGLLAQTVLEPGWTVSTFASGLSQPANGLEFDCSTGGFYVGEFGAGRVTFVDSAGNTSFFANVPTVDEMALDRTSTFLFAKQHSAGPVHMFDTLGTPLGTIGGLNGPTGTAFDSAGNFYLAEHGNLRILRYPASTLPPNTPVASVYATGFGSLEGMRFDCQDNLFITEWLQGNVLQVVPPNGPHITWVTGQSTPINVAFDPCTNNLFVSNLGSGTILRVTSPGVFTTFATGLSQPFAIVFDAVGNLYVNEFGAARITKFTTSSPCMDNCLCPSLCEPVEDPEVRTQGFWKRVCEGPHPSGEHENLPGYVDCVSNTDTFADVDDVDALCDRLHPLPKNDKCEKAEAQFMALLLNICSGRVAVCNCIDDPDFDTVGEAADFIDELLSNPGRRFDDCVLAQAIADDINNGVSLVDCP